MGDYYELRLCQPKTQKLRELLCECSYRGPEYEAEMDDVVGSDAMESLPESVQKKRKGPRKVMEGMVECGVYRLYWKRWQKVMIRGLGVKLEGRGLALSLYIISESACVTLCACNFILSPTTLHVFETTLNYDVQVYTMRSTCSVFLCTLYTMYV